MQTQIKTRILIPALALLLLAAVVIGYQAVSAQDPVEPDATDPPAAPTGLTATHDGVGVMLEWDESPTTTRSPATGSGVGTTATATRTRNVRRWTTSSSCT